MRSSQRDFHRVVAIDGPAASGKSSVARELAQRLSFVYVNSGAIYRAITWHLLEKGITAEDFDGVIQALESASITSRLMDGESRIVIDHADSSRPVSPLVIAKDAHVIDTSRLTVEKVVCEILARLTETGLWI